MALISWIPEVFAIFRKKSSLPSFLPFISNSSHCSFVICFALALAWFLISALGILTGKKQPKIKLQRLQKIRLWTIRLLAHQINSFQEVLKLEKIFQKSKRVSGKTPLFVIGPFCSCRSICLNIGFRQSSSEWK